MLAMAIRELRRRRLRSILTAGGIAIGVMALVLLGALGEKMGRLVAGGRDFAAGQITISGSGAGTATGMMGGSLVSGEQIERVRDEPGVAAVAPIVMFPLSKTPAALPFTLAPMAFGVDLPLLLNNPTAPDEIVVGSQVAAHFGIGVGSTLEVRGQTLRVIGVLEPTFTGPDSFVFMPYPTAQRMLIDGEPLLRRLIMAPGSKLLPIATAAAVFWTEGTDPEALAEKLRTEIEGLSVLSPGQAEADIDRALAFLISMIVGSGVVALVVASLAVTNTMFTAVVERRREIGLRRVVGATRGQVVRQLVLEALMLGLAGAALGLLLGSAAVQGLNAVTARMGAPVFLLTTRLALAAGLVPPLLAAVAGLWPAWSAARMSPTDAVRYV
jgi:putative ABC transport system permease protein